MTLDIRLIPLLTDNYGYLIRDGATGLAAVVDPSEASPVLAAAETLGWTISAILNTHHHPDHIAGDLEIKAATGAMIVGPAADQERIPGIDVALGRGQSYRLGESTAAILDVPGHTRGHIAFWFADSRALFCGDTLFALGCGRMFEGTPTQFWRSLDQLRALPGETRVYCGHEYTQSNARFARSIEPDNAELARRAVAIDQARAEGRPTIPSTIAEERATNPFFRIDQPAVLAALGLPPGDDVAAFAALRTAKDHF